MERVYTEINNLKIKHRPRDKSIIKEVFREDPYHISQLPRDSVVVDVGAHIGTVSLRAAQERGCTVYAYEPFGDSFQLLMDNVIINRLGDKIYCYHQAVGGERQRRKFYSHKFSGGSSLYLADNPDFPLETLNVEQVECVTLKHILEFNQLDHVDVLKMDCEGCEKEVFTVESKPFFKRIGRVMLEWHHYDGHEYRDYLEELGFTVKLTGTGDPVPAYKPSFERGMLYARQ